MNRQSTLTISALLIAGLAISSTAGAVDSYLYDNQGNWVGTVTKEGYVYDNQNQQTGRLYPTEVPPDDWKRTQQPDYSYQGSSNGGKNNR